MHQNEFSRRDFLAAGLAAGFCCASGCVSAGKGSSVKFGIISDTHVTGRESVEELSRAFAFLRDKGVDAVIHCGDMTDFGYLHQLEAFAEAWRVMPPDIPLIPVLGNRDLTDTGRISPERLAADRQQLILSDPVGHLRRILGIEIGNGIRAVQVRGINVVVADWKHEGELEAFMRARADLLDPSRPLVQVQHPHPSGIFSREPDQNPVTCWLNMFPKAISVSGHSHIPFSSPFTFCAGEFTFVDASSHYLSGGLQQKGIREVSVMTVSDERMHIDRYRLHDGSFDSLGRTFEEKRQPSKIASPASFVFATWNIGAFTHGCGGAARASQERYAADLRRQIADMDADIIGVGEYRPEFKMGSTVAREVFGVYKHSAVGPLTGGNCNAVFSRRFPISGVRCSDFTERKQRRYFIACDIEIGGEKAVLVQTHLDLDEEMRRRQLARLVNEFKSQERVIVAGDFNISHLDEYRIFTDAGFKMANASSFGRFRTHRKRWTSFNTAIDNVFVRGFDILDAWTDDDSMLLSDHRILVCRLRPSDGGASAKARTCDN